MISDAETFLEAIDKFQFSLPTCTGFFGIATIFHGAIIQGDSCPWDFGTNIQLFKENGGMLALNGWVELGDWEWEARFGGLGDCN